jgi:hypothetical protein
MDDKLLFVQFPHPGGEHGEDLADWKCWNHDDHKRKFLRRAGKYAGCSKVQEILFWGEWEPESKVQRIKNPLPCGPRSIHEPCYIVPGRYRGLQNTDPFVFGKEFLYGVCKQPTFRQLRHLKPGSIILFGSYKDGGFVLDTLFVVGNRPPLGHSSAKDLEGHVRKRYLDVTVKPWYKNSARGRGCGAASRQKCRLYFGATPDNPVDGMYSFFPCQPYKANSRGFARPRIRLPNRINDNLNQGVRFRDKDRTEQLELTAMKSLWDKVVKQVKDQHLKLGVYAEMPEKCSHSPCSGR